MGLTMVERNHLKRDIGRCQDRLRKQAKLKEDRRRKEVRSAPLLRGHFP